MAILFAAAQPTGATEEEVEIPLWATGAAAAAGAALCYAPPVLAYSVLFLGAQDGGPVVPMLFGVTAVSAGGVCGTLAAVFLPTSYGMPPNIAAGIGSGVGSLIGVAASVASTVEATKYPPFNTTATAPAVVIGGVGLGLVAGAFAGASFGALAGDAPNR